VPFFSCVLHSRRILLQFCNFPVDEVSSFIGSITNIRNHFGLILEIHCVNILSNLNRVPQKM